ncbi:MAG TPA: tetratricopeptide repeat protein [Thermoanaerobaculia bacterium]
MKKTLLVVALLVVAAVAAVALARWLRPPQPEWTTDSPEALAELQAGQQAVQKLYLAEAADHFWRALEHDPDFAIAKLRAVQLGGSQPERRERVAALIEELKAADLDGLTPRERMLIGIFLARIDHDDETSRRLLDEYLAEHPDDPYAVEMACGRANAAGDLDRAESCFRRLIEIDPNHAGAQNLLGYLAMARGDFAAAEEQFEVYRYVAPDQANPHDSLGELYLLTGRYDEAESEFEQAVAIKGDFCASHENLVLVELLRGDFAAADRRAAEARRANGCEPTVLDQLDCRVATWRAVHAGRWGEALAAAEPCPDAPDLQVISVWAAGQVGRPEAAAAVIERLETYGGADDPMLRPVLAHLRAAELYTRGDAAAAAERFRAVDGEVQYRSGAWTFKVFNQMALAAALEAAGRADEAAAVRAEVAEVNPRLLADGAFRIPEAPASR